MTILINYLQRHKHLLNLSGIAKQVGVQTQNLHLYVDGKKPLPDKYAMPILNIIIELGGGVWLVGKGWHIEKLDDHNYQVWCVAEELETIDCESYFKYPVKFKHANLSRDIITDISDLEEFFNSISDAD